MKTTIVGAGAIGTLLAALLLKAKNDVWLIDNDEKKVEKLAKDGLRLENESGSFRSKVNATLEPKDVKEADVIFICVKSYQTENALKSIKALIDKNTCVVSLQDGLGNLQVLEEYVEQENIIGAVTSHTALLLDAGHVMHTGKGETVIGQEGGKVLGAIREIANVLTKANFHTKVTKDINSAVWSRAIIAAGIGPLSAITRLKNGSLVKNEYTREIMRRAVSEAAKVAKRKRIKLLYDDPIQKVEALCRATQDNVSSMLQDVTSGRPTEIDFINGAICRQAKSLNIKTPTNDMLTELVKAVEANYAALVLEACHAS